MSDQKADIVVPLVDGIRPSREFSQDPLVDKSQLLPSTSSGHTPCSSKSKSCFSPHLLKKDTKQGAPGTVDLFTSTTQPSPPCYTIRFQRLSWLQALQVRLHRSICACSQKWPRRQGPTPVGVWRGGVQAAMVQQWQSAVVLGQDEQPQGLAVHQGMPAPASLTTASQQCEGGRAGGLGMWLSTSRNSWGGGWLRSSTSLGLGSGWGPWAGSSLKAEAPMVTPNCHAPPVPPASIRLS